MLVVETNRVGRLVAETIGLGRLLAEKSELRRKEKTVDRRRVGNEALFAGRNCQLRKLTAGESELRRL